MEPGELAELIRQSDRPEGNKAVRVRRAEYQEKEELPWRTTALHVLSTPSCTQQSTNQHTCVSQLPEAGKEPPKRIRRTVASDHTQPVIVPVPTSQIGKTRNSRDFG